MPSPFAGKRKYVLDGENNILETLIQHLEHSLTQNEPLRLSADLWEVARNDIFI